MNQSVITWIPCNMRLNIFASIALQLLPIAGAVFLDPRCLLMYLVTPISLICCLYEIFYMSKCTISFEKKTVIVRRPMHKDIEYPLCEVRWSATMNIDLKRRNIYLCQGKKKIMKISDRWENYDFLMTFPHLHPNCLIELELIKRRNERLKLERQYKALGVKLK